MEGSSNRFVDCPVAVGLTRLDLGHRVADGRPDLGGGPTTRLATLTRLQVLDLSGHKRLTSGTLAFLSSFVRLRELNLSGTAAQTSHT